MTNFTTPIHVTDISSNYTQKIENDSQGRAIYIGLAFPGTLTSLDKWQIKKLTYDSNSAVTDVQFAEGSNAFNKIWDLRGTYIYT